MCNLGLHCPCFARNGRLKNTAFFVGAALTNGPGPLNITFRSDMPITLLHLIYLVNSEMKNVIGMSDPNVMFKGLGPMILLFC